MPNMAVISDCDNEVLGVIGVDKYGLALLNGCGPNHEVAAPLSMLRGATVREIKMFPPEARMSSLKIPRPSASASAHAGALQTGVTRIWFHRSGWPGDTNKNLLELHLLRTVSPSKKW